VPLRRLLTISAFTSLMLLGTSAYRSPTVSASVGFQPVSPEELKMTSEPLAPGAPAIILYREVDRDDNGRTSHGGAVYIGSGMQGTADRFEDNYYRIKILTEEGRKYANVEIPLPSFLGMVTNVIARTIRSDGSIVNFDGKTLDKTIFKRQGYKFQAKTFTLPDVQVGSIIEYYYTISFNGYYVVSSDWILSNELFTRRAKFSLRPLQNDYVPVSFRWTEQLRPGSSEPKQGPDGIVRLEASNIPAFQSEDFMPPENELKERVDFIYSFEPFEMDVNKFWKQVGKKRNATLEAFLNKRGSVEQALAEIASPTDSPEVKLHKIYARVQQLRNTSYEVQKTEQEKERDQEKPAENVDEVWRRGFGSESDLTWLFLALARSAGLEAYGVLVPNREQFFFNPKTMNSRALDQTIVLVKLNGKDLYLAPAAAFTPFGLLKWQETAVQGLRLDKDGGTWIETPLPDSSVSEIERTANLKLSDTGDLEGKVTVTFTGLEALRRRVEERNEDQAARKRFLEDELKQYIPAAAEVELANQPDWASSAEALVAEFKLKIPGWASPAGRRELLSVGLFSATEKHLFDHTERVQPIYMEFPSQRADDVTIELPAGWQVGSLPPAPKQNAPVLGYSLEAEDIQGRLHLRRSLRVDFLLLDPKYYPALRNFFHMVKAGDEEQVVLQAGTASASN
jgi:hypothetical protein